MRTIPQIEARRDELIAWRRDLHAHPELAYAETRTAAFVAQRLKTYGLAVHEGLARTGVVGTLVNSAGPAIALRADLDALPLEESNDFAHRSRCPGRMHACGHDGHAVMLLGAARHLAEHSTFAGTIHFVFQPAEEAAGGAKVMLDDGLFERFPVDAIFGMHNWPELAAGTFGIRAGPLMASLDRFDIVIEGRGGHGAMPQAAVDPTVVAAQLVGALQTIVSRNVDPLQAAVVSVTKLQAGDSYNIIPDRAVLAGGIRCFDARVRELVKARLAELACGVAAAHRARATVTFGLGHPAVINSEPHTRLAARVAAALVGEEQVAMHIPPTLASEDFSHMLEARPGCYVFIGNGGAEMGRGLHCPSYDFNDDLLTLGASYWVELARAFLADPLA